MSSINLLPEDFKFKGRDSKEKITVVMLSFFLIFVSAVSYVGVYIDKVYSLNNSVRLDSETEKIDAEIKKEINNSELISVKDKTENVKDLLGEHRYFSKALKLLQDTMADDVYLTKSDLSLDKKDGSLVLKFDAIAKNHLAAVDQIVAFKSSYWVEDANVGGFSSDKDGRIGFGGNLKLKKDLVLYHDDYWNFGLDLLSSKIGRYIKITKYFAKLEKKTGDDGENVIEIKFNAVAHNKEKIALFEDSLKQMEIFVRDVSIFYDMNESKDTKEKTIGFRGEMKLNY